jgi:energy-coupling factor transport system ATP-binding protein
MDIEIRDVHFSYISGLEVLGGISLTIASGERVAIVGQNGAGKTTLVKQMNGLLKPTSGSVFIGGKDTKDLSVAKLSAMVGYVFQNPDVQLFSSTVDEEVRFGPRNLGFKPDKVDQLVESSLELTGLQNRRQVNPYDLSPTWRKMVAFASVIAMDTGIVILDEPTTGQDALMVQRIASIITALCAQGKTVITITHDIDFGAANFTRLIAMVKGSILLDGFIKDVVAQEDVLAMTFVDPPQITRLGKGLGFEQVVINQAEFLGSYQKMVEDGN